MIEISSGIRSYAWGQHNAITQLLGIQPTGGPEAELWLGAHPGNPSRAIEGTTLTDIIAANPREWLGEDAGKELPYLFKILAAAKQLSIQVHPNREQAEAGFAAENAAGVPLNADHRTYKDRHPKPEVLVAHTEMLALTGLAPAEHSAAALADLATPELQADPTYVHLIAALQAGDLETAVRTVLGTTSPDFIAHLTAAAARSTSQLAAVITSAASAYPGDAGIAVAALMNPVRLAPGDAVFVDAGILHSYVHGIGAELQAPSDNVLRGGLTPKYVDVEGLAAMTVFESTQPHFITPTVTSGPGWSAASYEPPAPFTLIKLQFDDAATAPVPGSGPRIVFPVGTPIVVASDEVDIQPAPGDAVFVGAGEQGATILSTGPGTVYIAAGKAQ